MTTTFDALQRILNKYKEVMELHDYKILQRTISTIHDLQHAENSHRIDSLIEQGIIYKKEFQEWRNGRDLSLSKKLKEVKHPK